MSVDSYCLSDDDAVSLLRDAPWRRFAVLGDSLAAGIGDDTPGYPTGGWQETLARVLRRVHPGLAYLSVGRRGLLAREVRESQFEPALAFGPDLAALVCGGNDSLEPSFEIDSVAADLDHMVGELRARGSDVLLFGLMDITTAGLIDPQYAPMVHKRLVTLADATRTVADRHGAIYLRMTEHPAAAETSLYSSDLLHANGRGHAVLAGETVRRLAAHLALASQHA
ncbi:MAG: hypothetical protein DLM58_06960 [Pseudonocardiales bacterium]|nr:MAG: hypothetical protein DLM58_06960 [Pseudonocardiales bacterium]